MSRKKQGECAIPCLDKLDMASRVEDKKDYEQRLSSLQLQMLRIQQAYYHQKRRAIIVFEGWDASGKGGTIRRVTERLDPRGYKVWPISKPSEDEQGRHYLYRFWRRLPEPGTLAIFDRSWYGRVLVERVEGLASREEWKRAYEEINFFERMLVDDGARIVKVFLHITPEEQLERFAERLRNPYKRWKITEEDIRNRGKWPQYERAIRDMFEKTTTPDAPWHVIPANQKWFVRVAALELITSRLAEGVDIAPPPLDPVVQVAAAERLGLHIVQDIKVKRKGKGKAKKKG